jgi:hypothetical protein
MQHAPGGAPDCQQYVGTIRGNLIETMQLLLVWAEKNKHQIQTDLLDSAMMISGLNPSNCAITDNITSSLEALWNDDAVQEAFRHRDETVIPDHMEHFYRRLHVVMEQDYVPTAEDILRARIRTIGIDHASFEIDGALIRFLDIGGQRNERRKIDQEVDGIVFCVGMADFDKPMFEVLPVIEPRITDAVEYFRVVSHNPDFTSQEGTVFLMLNKYDQFMKVVKETDRFARAFPDYCGDKRCVEECARFIVEKFRVAAGADRTIEVITQNALESTEVVYNANRICKYIREHCFDETD